MFNNVFCFTVKGLSSISFHYKEMCHILGLHNNPFLPPSGLYVFGNNGWDPYSANRSTKKRYEVLYGGSPLNYHILSSRKPTNLAYYTPSTVSPQTASREIAGLAYGNYIGFLCSWAAHYYSLHAINEGDTTHFIYLNKGQPASKKKENIGSEKVIVFSIQGPFKTAQFAFEMAEASHKGRTEMSKFLQKNDAHTNKDLTSLIDTYPQKTGNCGTANSNKAWHFQLAADKMKSSMKFKPKSFSEAYKETHATYKELRKHDRVKAFKYLLSSKKHYYLPEMVYFYNFIHALSKLVTKDEQDSDPEGHIALLLNEIKDNPKLLNALIEPLVNSDFEKKIKKLMKKTNGTSYTLYHTRDIVLHQLHECLPKAIQNVS